MIEKCFTTKEDIVLGSHFNVPVLNVLWQLVASARFSTENAKDASVVKMVNDIFQNRFITDATPLFLAKMFPKKSGLARMKEVYAGLSKFLKEIIKEHRQELDKENPQDFIDVYLTEVNNESENFNTDELFNCIFDFILVGMETTSTTLKWALLFLTLHQDVQDRCRNEVYEVVGSAKVPVANRPSMPFLQATIAEIQRLSSVSTFVPHVTTAPTKVGEFNFPKNSFFNVNLRFIMNDPAHFDKPE